MHPIGCLEEKERDFHSPSLRTLHQPIDVAPIVGAPLPTSISLVYLAPDYFHIDRRYAGGLRRIQDFRELGVVEGRGAYTRSVLEFLILRISSTRERQDSEPRDNQECHTREATTYLHCSVSLWANHLPSPRSLIDGFHSPSLWAPSSRRDYPVAGTQPQTVMV